MSTTCNNCGNAKPDDRFRACPDCRAYWRAADQKRCPQRMRHRRTIAVDRDILDQLEPAAKARGLTVNALVRRLLSEIADDALVESVLDDEEPA